MKLFQSKKLFSLLLAAMGAGLLLMCSCRKTEDPPRQVGKPLPSPGATRTLVQLMDSLPDATLYKAMYLRSDLQSYMDSLNQGNMNAPYTLFVPTDRALIAAGYTKDVISSAPVAQLDTLVRYLAIPGNFRTDPTVTAGTTCYPLMDPDPNLTGTFNDYFYVLGVGFVNNTLFLNGRKASTQVIPVAATNGSIYRLDTLIQKPQYRLYDIVASDTSLSLFLAGMRLNDSIYQERGILGDPGYYANFNDTGALQFMLISMGNPGGNSFSIVLAPTNDAFRKAGLGSVDAIRAFVSQSLIASSDYNYTYMQTNLDSIFQYHVFCFGARYVFPDYSTYDPSGTYVYTYDMANNPALLQRVYTPPYGSGSYYLFNVVAESKGGQIEVRRNDTPRSRAATIIAPSDVTTLNGVLHRVDNLLLPTP